ncbi:MAG: hypothetical protein MUQ26_08545, partial [Armatimonadetes bacterium]|nr:hypothetical protein [Armatimonadota bacterium]
MTHRERILTTLQHREPDRVPIDLGGTESSGMTAAAYTMLKRHLGLPLGCLVFEPYQHVVLIEDGLKDRFDVAAYPVIFGPRRWRAAQLPDGSPCEFPEKWRTTTAADGPEEAHGPGGAVIGRRAATGHHFDPVSPPLADAGTVADIAKHRRAIARFDWPHFADESAEEFVERARSLRAQSDRAAILNFQSHILAAGQLLRGFDNFMSDLILAPALADALLAELVDAYCERADLLFPALNSLIDVILVNDDLGTQ